MSKTVAFVEKIAQMEQCPNEILELITRYACTDDGSTGRSLSLVSRKIRNGSYRFALQSVAVYGVHHLSLFAGLMERRTPEERLVYHMYLSDRRRSAIENIPGLHQGHRQWVDEYMDSARRAQLSEAVNSILQAVGPGLRTLGLVLFQRNLSNFLAMLPSPSLEELTIRSSLLHCDPKMPLLQYPTLRRLYILSDSAEWTAREVSELAPHLTHLRVSRLKATSVSTQALFGALQIMVYQLTDTGTTVLGAVPDDGTHGPILPLTLTHIIVQMSQPASTTTNPELGTLNSLTADFVKSVAQGDRHQRIVVERPALYRSSSYSPDGLDSDYGCYARARSNWEARMIGGEGAWDIPAADITSTTRYTNIETLLSNLEL